MNKRIKRKIAKGKFYYCYKKGSVVKRMLWQHHSYQYDVRSREIMLAYDVDGNECYFKTWRAAKHYIRRMKGGYELDWGSEDEDTTPVPLEVTHLSESELPY